MRRSYFSWEEDEAYKQGKKDESNHRGDYVHDKFAYDGEDRAYWDGREDEKRAERIREEERQMEEEQLRQEEERQQRQERLRQEEERQRRLYEDSDEQIQDDERPSTEEDLFNQIQNDEQK
jgi:hypothetical protein